MAFASYILRDEQTSSPVTLSDIHKLAIQFVEYARGIGKFAWIELPFEHGKSTLFAVAYPLWWWGCRSQNESIKLVSGLDDLVKARVRQMQTYLEGGFDGVYQRIFPDIKPDKERGWEKHSIYITREASGFPSMWAHSALGTGEGGRCGLLIMDDVITRTNTIVRDQNQEVIEAVEGTWLQRVYAGGFAVGLNTPWTTRDLAAHIKKSRLDRWAVLRVAVNKGLDGYDVQVIGD